MNIIRNGSVAAQAAPAEWFGGRVRMDMKLGPQSPASRATFNIVAFEPGGRTAWHTHPAGQMIIITQGQGWVQEWGGKRHTVHAGDMVWFPEGVKHWHGATDTTAMTHIAVQESVDGSAVEWLEQVSDAQYLQG